MLPIIAKHVEDTGSKEDLKVDGIFPSTSPPAEIPTMMKEYDMTVCLHENAIGHEGNNKIPSQDHSPFESSALLLS